MKIEKWVSIVNVTFPFVLTEEKLKEIDWILYHKDYEFIKNITPVSQLLNKNPRVLRFEYESRFISEKKFERLMTKIANAIIEYNKKHSVTN